MKKRTQKHYGALAAAMPGNRIVKLWRQPMDKHPLEGYVVGLSHKWVLLEVVEGDPLVLDGYKAVRLADISAYKMDDSFVSEYFQRRQMFPRKQPNVDLAEVDFLLRGISKDYAMFVVACERVEPDICFIGVIEKLTERNLWMKKFSSDAEWIETEKFKLKDITTISFGGGYVEALVWMDAHSRGAAREVEEVAAER